MMPTTTEAKETRIGPMPGDQQALPVEVSKVLSAFTDASRRVEDYYRHLEGEVKRLTGDLETRNSELRKKIVEKDRMQAMLISTLQSLASGVLAVGRDGIVVAANPKACEIFDKPVEELAGKRIDEVLPDVPGRGELIQAILAPDGSNAELEWTIEENGHHRRIINLTAIRGRPPYDEHLAGLIHAEDITSLRRLEQQAMVHSRLDGIGDLAVNLAHEIRNPLGSISLFATTLAHELADDLTLEPLAQNLVTGVNSLEHVVANVLEFARPRRISMSRVDLAAVLADAIIFIEHPRQQKSIELRFSSSLEREGGGEIGDRNGSEPFQALIAGDAEQLRQVFLNLLLNAIQAMEAGGILDVSLRAHGPEGWEVEITDNGVGIPEEDLERIFDPFFTTKEKGSGIGLAVVHRILTAHAAQIEVDSRVGVGTTFRIVMTPHPMLSEV